MSGFEADNRINDLNRISFGWRDLARKKWVNYLIDKFD